MNVFESYYAIEGIKELSRMLDEGGYNTPAPESLRQGCIYQIPVEAEMVLSVLIFFRAGDTR